MTFKEKWMEEHPDEIFDSHGIKCPHELGYETAGDKRGCAHLILDCDKCWNREIPETAEVVSTIKDSGDRTQFETGAVRDMREGKGRCDLMPLEVVAKLLDEDLNKPDLIVGSMALFKNSGYSKTVHLYNALLYFSQKYYENLSDMFLEVAKHFEEGAKKYGENNWQKGIPVHCYIDSAVRHYLKWRRGDKDEPHDRAVVWNLMCCIWEVDYRDVTAKESTDV